MLKDKNIYVYLMHVTFNPHQLFDSYDVTFVSVSCIMMCIHQPFARTNIHVKPVDI